MKKHPGKPIQSWRTAMTETDDLLAAALRGREAAYAPYSHFKVGAAVRARSGAIFTGCNVENASFPVGLCAESSAIAAMVAAGERRLSEILILGPDDRAPVPPCGACRQRILEFADRRTRILLATGAGVFAAYSCEELLPHAFSSRALGGADREGNDERNA